MNGFFGILLSIYLLAVIKKGNGNKLIELLSNEKGFILWIISIIFLLYIRKINSKIVDTLIITVFIALFMNAGKTIFSNTQKLIEFIKG